MNAICTFQRNNTCDKCDTCPRQFKPDPTSIPTSLVPSTSYNLHNLLLLLISCLLSVKLSALTPASLFSCCYNLTPAQHLPWHPCNPLNMNGTTEPVNAASAATQTTETIKMNGTSTTTAAAAAAPDAGHFGDELISPDVTKALPDGYKIRALRQSDFHAGFLDCLRVLTTVGDITEEQFAERFEWIGRQDGGYYILVIEDGGKVVGTGALIVERKLYVDICDPSIPRISKLCCAHSRC